MILIYPPVVKPCEPPAGIAKLLGVLNQHRVKCTALDANLEGLLYLMSVQKTPTDTWTQRAYRNLTRNLSFLKSDHAYHSIDRYKRAVMDINRILEMSTTKSSATIGLANYKHATLSPLRSKDLIHAAEYPEHNPFYPYFHTRLRELIESIQPSIVGFSLTYLSQALCTFAMVGFLKRDYPRLTVILGGGLTTSWMKNPLFKNLFKGLVDHFVAGPGEYYLLSIKGTKGIKEHSCPPQYDSLPINDYLAFGRILPYSASRGCYWNKCSFCPEKSEGTPYTSVPVEQVIADFNTLTTTMKPTLIHLLDNAISPLLLKALSDNPIGIPWYGFARFSNHLLDHDFCMTLKRSGCVMLKLGLESGDQGVLDKMHKGIDLSKASAALKTLRKVGIATYVYLLFGTPHETVTEARRTLEFIITHCNEINFLNIALFNMPILGTEVHKFKTTHFYDGDLALYTNFSHPQGWDRKLVRQFLDNEFRKNDVISSILKKTPPFFTSNHAPFFMRTIEN